MALTAGTRLGPYEIQSAIGAGGMGEVYRARDTKLDRSVAIKILPELFAHDPERLARFQREAKTLAALNHPNIAIIHGFEEAHGIRALVMELVEGPTLADRIAQGPIPVDEALPIAKQIADALEAAHEQGIIHRDLKPANVKVRPDSTVKVLDFGLAKAMEPAAGPSPSVSQSPTITTPAMTQAGMILGTAAYMSPEQARGKTVDKRADIWAFGCVLYEMLAGACAFRGETVSETLAEVLKSEPRWTELPPETPATLRDIVRRCLAKDPRQRVRDIGDVRLALESAFDTAAAMDTTAAVAAPRLRVWQRPAAAAIIALSIAGSAGLAVWALTRPSASRPVRLMVAPAAGETVGNQGPDPDLAISPDGTRIVFVASGGTGGASQLYVRALDQLEAQPLPGTRDSRTPFMSPDGNWVGFFDEPNVLKKVTVNGGPALTICNISGGPRGASWGPDNTIVFATNDLATGLLRVSAGGGEADVLTTPDAQKGELDHYWPEVLPGGKAVLFTILSKAGTVQNAQIAVLDLETGQQKVLVPGGSYPRYVPTGHLVYGVEGTLRAVAFDLDRLEVRSDPVPVLQRVVTKPNGAASFSVAQDGSLVYLTRGIQGGVERTLTWVDRQGRQEPLKAPPRAYTNPRISPDGTKVALDVRDQEFDIWVWDLGRATLTRLTFDPGFDGSPVWTPDGRRIAFSSTRGVAALVPNLYWQTADGTGAVERLTENVEIQNPASFSPDGTRLLFSENGSTTNNDIHILSLEGERRATPLVQTALQERNAEVSPDGRWVAYQSDESGRAEIYVRPFPEVNGGRWQVSTGGGIQPLWGHNGRELFYLVGPGRMMATPIQPGAGATFAAGNPRFLFDGQYVDVLPQAGRSYDVSPDGQRFLMIKETTPVGEAPLPPQLIVVQHWFEELKRLVPTR